MGLVKGFSDILSPVNLAVNGQFAINQRQNFTSLTPAKVGDVVSDGWKIQDCNTESLSVFNNTGLGHLNVTGSGKKGQSVFLYNFAAAFGLFALDNYWHNLPVTASVTAILEPASSPLRVSVTPAQLTGALYVLNNSKNIYAPGNKTQVISVVNNAAANSNWVNYSGIFLTLLADGPFSIHLTNFQHLFGCFYNPPERCPVPYSEDLLRCQRYYQKGVVRMDALGTSDGSSYLLGGPVRLRTMAGTPSIALANPTVYEEGAATNVQANYTFSSNNVDTEGFSWLTSKAIAGSKPRTASFNWTATI